MQSAYSKSPVDIAYRFSFPIFLSRLVKEERGAATMTVPLFMSHYKEKVSRDTHSYRSVLLPKRDSPRIDACNGFAELAIGNRRTGSSTELAAVP
jgi:hypothetical protein